MKTYKNNDFNQQQLLERYKYGLHCYGIALIILLTVCILKVFFQFSFENEFDLLLFILGIPGAYYVLRLEIKDALLPQLWRGKETKIIFIFIVLNVIVFVRWHGVKHSIKQILMDRIIYSDYAENFTLQIMAFFMLFSFIFREIRERRGEKEEKIFFNK